MDNDRYYGLPRLPVDLVRLGLWVGVGSEHGLPHLPVEPVRLGLGVGVGSELDGLGFDLEGICPDLSISRASDLFFH